MKKIIKAYLIICCILLASGCSNNEIIPEIRDGEGSRIALFIPGADEVRVYSTATADGNRIKDCIVLTFKDGYKKSEIVNVLNIVANGEASALLPQLSFKIETGDTVYVICNTGLTALSADIASITANDINATFPPAEAYYFSGDALPMSGSTIWSPTASSTVTLTRAVAKVQIKLGESFSIGNLDTPPYFDEAYRHQPNMVVPWDADFFKQHMLPVMPERAIFCSLRAWNCRRRDPVTPAFMVRWE
jgi:hypothetical protein